MAVKKIVSIPDSRLRQISQKITKFDEELQELIADLIDTLEAQTDPPGIGIAGVQIGVLKRIFIARLGNKLKEFINPEIITLGKVESELFEGCLSVHHYYGYVYHPTTVTIRAQDKKGEFFTKKYKGLPARIMQHETDHLNGILYVDHVIAQKRKLLKITAQDENGDDIFEEVNTKTLK